MESPSHQQAAALRQLNERLQKLIGFHRQLLDACRAERVALVQADLKAIQECTLAKQGLVESVRQGESQRIQCVAGFAVLWKRPVRELSLPNIIIAAQGEDSKMAEQLRSDFNALTVLIQRITEQNNDNKRLVERSLAHVNDMKRNVLGEAVPKSGTYSAHGQKVGVTGGARLISQEA